MWSHRSSCWYAVMSPCGHLASEEGLGSAGLHPPGWPGKTGPPYLIPMMVSTALSSCPPFAVFSFRRSRARAHLEWEGDTACGTGTSTDDSRRSPDRGCFSCPRSSQGLGAGRPGRPCRRGLSRNGREVGSAQSSSCSSRVPGRSHVLLLTLSSLERVFGRPCVPLRFAL